MKYNRKAVVAAIVKIQKEKFEEERTKLEAEKPILEDKMLKLAASFVSKLTKTQIMDGLKGAVYRVSFLTSSGKTTGASFTVQVDRDEDDKDLVELKEAYDNYHNALIRIREINSYLEYNYKHGACKNLVDRVNRDAPYDYELQADELLKSPKLSADIEALRKAIFED